MAYRAIVLSAEPAANGDVHLDTFIESDREGDWALIPGGHRTLVLDGEAVLAIVNNGDTLANRRLAMKAFLDPSIDTSGIEPDPALELDSVTDIWPGAEWHERAVYDLFGIRFRNHPDLRRILMWKDYPAHPLRKDYPLRGRGERETYPVVERDSS